jgi:hypothetical protein
MMSIGAKVKHPQFGEGVIIGSSVEDWEIFFKDHGDKQISRSFEGLELIKPAAKPDNSLSLDQVQEALAEVLSKFADFTMTIPLGDKWKGGTMVLQPEDKGLKSKDLPIETFFHKIVMVRDRLRVLEQNINSHPSLSDEEKVNLQQYITRIYGSLTTFNVLFAREKDHFKGESSK